MSSVARVCQPRILAIAFGAYFAIVAILSWILMGTLSLQRYVPSDFRWIYTTYLLAAAAFLVALTAFGLRLQGAFEMRVRRINRTLGHLLLDDGTGPTLKELLAAPSEDGEELDMDGLDLSVLLETLGEVQTEKVLMVPPKATGPSAMAVHRLQLGLLRQRGNLRGHEQRLLRFLAGPVAITAAIFGIAVTFLPSTDAAFRSAYALNTAVIVGLSYVWIGAVAYFALSALSLVSFLRLRKPVRGPSNVAKSRVPQALVEDEV